MYPRLIIDLNKIRQNARRLTELAQGVDLAFVTKVFCADSEIVSVLSELPVKYLADSRIENLKRIGITPQKKILLRLPMLSEADEVVSAADISLNSELKTLDALANSAEKLKKRHGVVLMVDLGDLREGIYFTEREKIFETADYVLSRRGLELLGVGTNLTCYGSVIPSEQNLGELCEIAGEIERRFDVFLPIVSGGNSSSLYLIQRGKLPARVNNLRLGEALVLGRETAFGGRIDGTEDDAVVLECEIVEVRDKPSYPLGEIGMNAFGERVNYEDIGIRRRAIAAVGRQDTDISGLTPLDAGVSVIGASSDHLLLDVTDAGDIGVGSTVRFKLDYSATLRLFTSGYVSRSYIK